MVSSVIGKPKRKSIPFSERKLEVLKAAAKLFNQRGYHNATMDDIAAALKVTKPALYYYAKSKDEILFEIITLALNEAERINKEIQAQSDSGGEQLKEFFYLWSDVVCHDFGRCMIFTKPSSLELKTRRKNRTARRRIHGLILTMLKLGIKDGTVAKCDAELASKGLFDLFNGVAHWYKPRGKYSPQQIADHYWQTFAAGLIKA